MTDPPYSVSIFHETDHLTTIKVGDGRTYDIVYDEYTDDWLLSSDQDEHIQGDWYTDRDGATQYVLKRLGLIEDASYRRAPDRC